MARKNTGTSPATASARSTLALADALFCQGFGTRRECEGLVLTGLVRVNGRTMLEPYEPVSTTGLLLARGDLSQLIAHGSQLPHLRRDILLLFLQPARPRGQVSETPPQVVTPMRDLRELLFGVLARDP